MRWSVAILSTMAVLKFIPWSKKNPGRKQGETTKMLTQDGKLVEIDKRLIASSGRKVSNEELQKWIKK